MGVSNAMISCLLIALLTTNLGAADGLLSLHATAPESMVKSGVGIVVRLTITNKTNYTVTYYDKRRDCDYLLTVLTSSGAPASDTPYKKELKCGTRENITGRNIIVTLKPGESKDDEIEITHLYD